MSVLVTLGFTFAAAGGLARAEAPAASAAGGAIKGDDDAPGAKKRVKRTKVERTETSDSVTATGRAAKSTGTGVDQVENKVDKEGGGPVAADNTGVNKRDRDDRAVTADQQSNNKSDVELTAEIRRAIVKDDSLSTNAHNVKIVVLNGQVTLKGPVGSAAEKAAVERKASAVVGKGKIVNELAVAP